MRLKKRQLVYIIPYTEIVQSGTIRLPSGIPILATLTPKI